MNLSNVMVKFEALGSEQTREVLRRHGAVDPFFGVKVGDLKPVAKNLKEVRTDKGHHSQSERKAPLSHS
jgi:hypothetical protein